MSNRFTPPSKEELAARGLGPDGKPLPAPKPAAKKPAKKATKKDD